MNHRTSSIGDNAEYSGSTGNPIKFRAGVEGPHVAGYVSTAATEIAQTNHLQPGKESSQDGNGH
jgi:hypothetical protein